MALRGKYEIRIFCNPKYANARLKISKYDMKVHHPHRRDIQIEETSGNGNCLMQCTFFLFCI